METNVNSGHPSIIPFKRKKWCIFCFIYSIPHRPGVYASKTRSQSISLTSNNANEIFSETKRSMPSPLVKAMDTDGLQIDEAIAWRRLNANDVKTEVEVLQQGSYDQIVIPQAVNELLGLSQTDPADASVVVGKGSKISPNSFLGALLLRLYTLVRFFVGYAVPLLIPFFFIKPDAALPMLAIFGVNLLITAFAWPFIPLKSWVKGILLALFTGIGYSALAYFVLPQFFQPGLSIAALVTGLLVGFILDCTDRDD